MARAPRLLLALALVGNAMGSDLLVDAGAHDRRDVLLTVALPAALGAGAWSLRAEDGAELPLQVDAQGQGRFVLDRLDRGQRRRFRIEAAAAGALPLVEVLADGQGLRAQAAGREVLRFQGGPGELPEGFREEFRRGGYLQRLVTPAGVQVLDDYPPKHQHHHGVWFAWTKCEFAGRTPDFWNMAGKTGTVLCDAVEAPWSGAVCGGFRARLRYVDLAAPATTVLHETWEVLVHPPTGGARPRHVVDLVVTQACAGGERLVLPTYHYGGIGLRGHRQWDGVDHAVFLTSEGGGRADGNGSRGRWCHLGGMVDGRSAGIAVLDHPANPRSPQPMRLHPHEPFFCFAPSQLGPWSIEPGTPLVLRYRLVVADGPPDAAGLERLWRDYAEPPLVTLP